MSTWLQDFRFAFRMLRKNPGVTLVVSSVVALGIGAVTAIFSVVNPFLLRPLPYDEPDRLVHLFLSDPQTGYDQGRLSFPQYLDWQAETRSFSELAVYDYMARNLTGGDSEPEQQIVGRLSSNLLPLLGIVPRLGRAFAPGEDGPGEAGVVILSDELWQRRYGGREDVLGETLHIDGEAHTVVGVMAPRFHFPYPEVKLWVPLPADRERYDRDNHRFLVIGRLAAGVSTGEALAELETVHGRLGEEYPVTDGRYGVSFVPLRQALLFAYDEIRILMVLLMGAVSFVLLIVSANVANILLARAGERSAEVAIRTSLGAARQRLMRQFLTESALLALLGGALGALFAAFGVRLIGNALPEALFRVGALEVDATALAFALGASLVTSLLFGLAPAFRGSRVDLAESLKEGARSAAGGLRGRRLRGLLVVSQLSLAVVLLAGAFSMVGTATRMRHLDLGFETGQALTMRLVLPSSKYETGEERAAFFDGLTRRLEGLPGVTAAAAVLPLPMSFSTYTVEFEIPGREPSDPDERLSAHEVIVTPRYFDALGIPIRRGRAFDDRDRGAGTDDAGAVVVSESFAERYWPGEDAVGRSLLLELSADRVREATVVGVAGDVRDAPEWQLHGLAGEQIYMPWAQRPYRGGHLVIRAAGGDPASLVPQVRDALRRADPDLPVTEVWTMEEVLAYSVSPLETASRLLAGFAAAALLLAAVGIYGVVAYTTSRRRHEFGVRLALGAGRGSIARLVLRQSAALTAFGVGVGLAASFVLGRVIASQMPVVTAPGVLALAAVAAVLAAAVLAASFLPAHRASRLDPLVALRYE